MKNLICVMLLSLCFAAIYAADETVINYAKGPVKQIIIANRYINCKYVLHNTKVRREIYTYDSKGRLKDEIGYNDNKFLYRYVYQYSDSICMKYEYGPKRIIKGNYCRMRMDSAGNRITSETYINGKFFSADSTVYDEYGRKIEHYEIPSQQNTFALRFTFEYDSLGRLSKKRDFLYGGGMVICSVEYLPDGSFTEYHSDVVGQKRTFHYFVNEKGLLVEVQWENSERTVYSDFDKYGNWLKSERIRPEDGTIVVDRVIEYYE